MGCQALPSNRWYDLVDHYKVALQGSISRSYRNKSWYYFFSKFGRSHTKLPLYMTAVQTNPCLCAAEPSTCSGVCCLLLTVCKRLAEEHLPIKLILHEL
eukprot:5705724-Amphidinium_carterae.1